MNEYYVVDFIINSKDYYCVWYTNDEDGFLVNDNKVVYFDNLNELQNYCKSRKITISNEITSYDFDKAIAFMKGITKEIDYKSFLEIWNICADLASSISKAFHGDNDGLTVDVYNLLFYGSNPSAMNDTGEIYTPKWDNEDVEELKTVLKKCIELVNEIIN